MDNEILVKELRDTISALRKTQGHVALFMLTAPEVHTSIAQNLIVSAKGYDRVPTKKALIDLANLLKSKLSKSSLERLSRLTVLKTQDPFVKAINQAFNIKNSKVSIQSSNIFGIHIENAVIFESVSFLPQQVKPTKKKIIKPKNTVASLKKKSVKTLKKKEK